QEDKAALAVFKLGELVRDAQIAVGRFGVLVAPGKALGQTERGIVSQRKALGLSGRQQPLLGLAELAQLQQAFAVTQADFVEQRVLLELGILEVGRIGVRRRLPLLILLVGEALGVERVADLGT